MLVVVNPLELLRTWASAMLLGEHICEGTYRVMPEVVVSEHSLTMGEDWRHIWSSLLLVCSRQLALHWDLCAYT